MAGKVSHKMFNGKLLLFGEHIINKGAMGLAMPLERYNGVMRFGSLREPAIRESNTSLNQLAHFIVHNEALTGQYDTNKMLEDVEQGLYFDSNIPMGYGLGSSGALVAAVYHEYRKFKKKTTPVTAIKSQLAELEGHYHGKSSGLDAIVSYLNKAVLLNNGEVTETFDMPAGKQQTLQLFAIDTHVTRKTSTYVNLFLDNYREKAFQQTVEKSLAPATNMAIEAFMELRYADLMKSVKLISQLQFDMLPEFIPKKFVAAWQEGLRSNQYHLKICGAGGGGFILGFTRAEVDLASMLPGLDVQVLRKF